MNTRLRHLLPRWTSAVTLLLSVALLVACGGPPTEALDDAERTILDAAWAEDCAGETYRSAQKMLAEARAASEAGDYDEAERKAEAAKRLAEQARQDAELGQEECERRKQAMEILEEKYEDPNQGSAQQNAAGDESLQTVYFEFNQSALDAQAQENLQKNASWLLENPAIAVRIEGHTDTRGSTEYNLALSQRRAAATKRYLQALGIDPTRMKVVPYGEERLATYGEDENEHARNRRAEFVPIESK